jgi:hypothetical protein
VTEVVYPVDGEPVILRPCPPWCTLERHFSPEQAVHADDGYFHYGPEAEIATGRPFPDQAGGEPAVVRVYLTSWTHPLDASPGPAFIEVNLGTEAHRTDMAAELTPAQASAAAWALLERADTAERASEQDRVAEGLPARRASGGELLAGILQMRIERWLELEGVFDIPGFGDVELAAELDWEPGTGPVYLRRTEDNQVWRADIAITARPATAEEAKTALQREQDTTAQLRRQLGALQAGIRALAAEDPSVLQALGRHGISPGQAAQPDS